MRSSLPGDDLGACVAERMQIEAGEKVLAFAQQRWTHRQMQLVNKTGAQKLTERRYAPAKPYILVAGRRLRLSQRGLDAVGDEMEHGAAFHRNRRARVMREHEHRHVVRRFLAPPAFPVFVRPRSAHRTEHVAAENPRADIDESQLGHFIVATGFAARTFWFIPAAMSLVMHGAPHVGREKPFHELRPAHAERILQVLARTGAETVQRNREAAYK